MSLAVWAEQRFESFANSKRYKTPHITSRLHFPFESFANSKRYKTINITAALNVLFESFANSKRYKTCITQRSMENSLRALLIQKDTKHAKMGTESGRV